RLPYTALFRSTLWSLGSARFSTYPSWTSCSMVVDVWLLAAPTRLASSLKVIPGSSLIWRSSIKEKGGISNSLPARCKSPRISRLTCRHRRLISKGVLGILITRLNVRQRTFGAEPILRLPRRLVKRLRNDCGQGFAAYSRNGTCALMSVFSQGGTVVTSPAPPSVDATALALRRRNVALLLAAVALVGVHIGIFESTFNNYLDAVHRLDASSRGVLEFPRELPGFLVALLSGLLFLLPDSRAAAVAMGALALGLLGLGYFSDTFGVMVAWLMLWSAGHHLFMPLEQSLAVSLADAGQMGRRLGQVATASTIATIAGAAIVWVGVDYLNLRFTSLFSIAAVAVAGAGAVLWRMQVAESGEPAPRSFKSRFFFRKEYGVFYAMCVLFGARKQVFITFAPWVLVQVFGEPASTIAKLWVASSLLGIVFKPLLGRLIDRWGERPILV